MWCLIPHKWEEGRTWSVLIITKCLGLYVLGVMMTKIICEMNESSTMWGLARKILHLLSSLFIERPPLVCLTSQGSCYFLPLSESPAPSRATSHLLHLSHTHGHGSVCVWLTYLNAAPLLNATFWSIGFLSIYISSIQDSLYLHLCPIHLFILFSTCLSPSTHSASILCPSIHLLSLHSAEVCEHQWPVAAFTLRTL